MRLLLMLLLLSPALLATELRDPTAPPPALASATAPPVAASGLRLQQVITTSPARAAINGRWLRPGDAIDGWTLRVIERRSVVLEGPAGEQRLTLFDGGQSATRGE